MIVSGCQRSGTKSVAKMFGLDYEKIFNPTITLSTIPKGVAFEEVSWFAAPFIKYFQNQKIPIIRLVRHPQAVVNSLLGINFWHDSKQKPYRNFILKFLPQIDNFKSPMKKSVYYWTHWNRLLGTIPTIKIESITDALVLNHRNRADAPLHELKGTSLWRDLEETMNAYCYNF